MESLRTKAKNSFAWSGLGTATKVAFRLLGLLVVARLLQPHDFGLMAAATIVLSVATVLTQFGLSEAIIHNQEATSEQLSTLYWINVGLGIIVTCMMAGLAPFIAGWFKEPELCRIVLAISTSVIVLSSVVQIDTLLRKKLLFKLRSLVDIIATSLGLILTIILAYAGHGAWALVWGSLGQCYSRGLLLLLIGKKQGMLPKFHFRWSDSKDYLGFGLWRVGASLVREVNTQVDQFVVGTFMGTAALGLYNMAFRVTYGIMHQLMPPLNMVAFPAIASIQHDRAKVLKSFLEYISFLTAIFGPILGALFVLAPGIVPFLLGDQWIPIIQLVQIFSLYSLVRVINAAGGTVVLALGKANWTFYWAAILVFIIPVTVVIVSKTGGGIERIALCVFLLHFVLFFGYYFFFLRPLLGNIFIPYIIAIARPVLATSITMLAVYPLIVHFLPITLMKLIGIVVFTIVVYVLSSVIVQRQNTIVALGFIPLKYRNYIGIGQAIRG